MNCPYCESKKVSLNVTDGRYLCQDCQRLFDEDDILREDLRHRLSPLLAGTNERRPLRIDAKAPSFVPWAPVDKVFLFDDGTIWFHIAGTHADEYKDIDCLSTDDIKAVVEATEEKRARLKRNEVFVRAIIAYLKQKKRVSVSFELSTYECENDVPYCNTFSHIIDTVSAPCLWPREEFLSLPDDERKTIEEKGADRCISICVEDEGCVKYGFFNGTEDEDFDDLFNEIYHYINDADDPEAEEWLKENEINLI